MMVLKTMLILLLAVNVNSGSWSTSKLTPRSTLIEGLWEGTFTTAEGSSGKFYFAIKNDGNILIENYYLGVQRIANGSWTLNGYSFTCTGTYFYGSPENIGTITTHTAILNDHGELTMGVWKNMFPNHDTGKFSMTKLR